MVNHNPVKTSNINKPGATPQIFSNECDSRTKKLTHRPRKIPLRKHVNLEKGKKFSLFHFCFHLLKNLIHAIFLKFHFNFPQNPGPCRIPGPRTTFKSQIPTPPGKFFDLIPGGCPGGCTQLKLTETLVSEKVPSVLKYTPRYLNESTTLTALPSYLNS